MTDREIRSGEAAIVQTQVDDALRESKERITITENGDPGNGPQFEITVPTGACRMNPDANNVYRSKP